MAIMVRDLPPEERPREKLLSQGPRALSNAELLAILLRSGTKEKSVLRIAEEILAHIKEQGLSAMVHISAAELAKIDGVGQVKAATLQAAIELGRRLAVQQAAKIEVIHGPEDVAAYALPRFRFEQKEHFAVMLLNTREVFRAAIDDAAAAMSLLHNHPSGDPTPSREDIAVTDRLVKAGKVMDIPVLDHVVLGRETFASFKDKGLIH